MLALTTLGLLGTDAYASAQESLLISPPAIVRSSAINTGGEAERFSLVQQAEPQLWWTLSRFQVPANAKAALPDQFTGTEVIRHQVDINQKSSTIVLIVNPAQFPLEAPIVTGWNEAGSPIVSVDFSFLAGGPALRIQLGEKAEREEFVAPLLNMAPRPIALLINVSDRFVQVWGNGQLQLRQEVRRKDRNMSVASWGIGLRASTPEGQGFRGTVEHFALFEKAPSIEWFNRLTSTEDAAPGVAAAPQPMPEAEAQSAQPMSEQDDSLIEPIPDESIVGRDDSESEAQAELPKPDDAPMNQSVENESAGEEEPIVPMPDQSLIELEATDESAEIEEDETPIGAWDRANADEYNMLGERIGDVRRDIRSRPEAPLYRPEFYYAPEVIQLPGMYVPVCIPGIGWGCGVYIAPRTR